MLLSFLKSVLLTFIVFVSPIKGMICLVSFAVFLDTAFAIYVTIRLHGLKSFKSTKLFNVVVKTFFYMTTILLAFLIGQFIFDGSVFGIPFLVSKSVTFVWLYIEIKSLDETSQKYGNRSIWVILKELISKTKDLKKDINELQE
jgi:hypothetical protein